MTLTPVPAPCRAAAASEIRRGALPAPPSSPAGKPLAELRARPRPAKALEGGSSAIPGQVPGTRPSHGRRQQAGFADARGGKPSDSRRGSSRRTREGHGGSAKTHLVLELELELGPEPRREGRPAPKPFKEGPHRRAFLLNTLGSILDGRRGGLGPDLLGATGYLPAVEGFAGERRRGRWKDQPPLVKAGWRLKAARLVLDPERSRLVTLNLADEEVAANDRAGRHLAALAGQVRKALLRDLGSPAFVSALELHKSHTASEHPVNPCYGGHAHLVLDLPEELLPVLERRLFRYAERSHAWALRRQGLEPSRIRQERRPDGSALLRLDLPGRTVGEGHLRRGGVGLAAHLARVDPDRVYRRTGRPGLEGALDYVAKDLHRFDRRLRDRGLRDGEGEGGDGRRVRGAEALHASGRVESEAMRLFRDPDEVHERFLAAVEAAGAR